MNTSLQKLIEIASTPASKEPPTFDPALPGLATGEATELMELLRQKNGFWAFEGALHVLPAGPTSLGYDLNEWNSAGLWRGEYDDMAEHYLFFAEDIFGEQFALKDEQVWRFSPETGQGEVMADSLEEWAAKILGDYEVETGYGLAHEWQQLNGYLPVTHRLLPKMLFVAGGKYEVANLYALNAVKGMRFRAAIAKQIRNLPDGTTIQFEITE